MGGTRVVQNTSVEIPRRPAGTTAAAHFTTLKHWQFGTNHMTQDGDQSTKERHERPIVK